MRKAVKSRSQKLTVTSPSGPAIADAAAAVRIRMGLAAILLPLIPGDMSLSLAVVTLRRIHTPVRHEAVIIHQRTATSNSGRKGAIG